MNARAHNPTRGFTLIEMLVVIVIIALLISILLVALAGVRRTAKAAAERQNVVSLKMGVEQFKADHGFLPPMVKDVADCKYRDRGWQAVFKGEKDAIDSNGDPIVFNFSVAQENRTTRSFLRGGSIDADSRSNADFRFSEYSLPYYLLGALGASSDGVEGPGFLTPKRDGSFSRKGTEFSPYYDIGDNVEAMVLNTNNGDPGCSPSQYASISRYELRDGNGIAYRYYRWLPGQPNPSNGEPGTTVFIQSADDLNVPAIVGDPSEDPDLRDAGYAIVAAGANKTFGDFGTEANFDNSIKGAEYVKQEGGMSPSLSDEAAKRKAREDNIVEVGGK